MTRLVDASQLPVPPADGDPFTIAARSAEALGNSPVLAALSSTTARRLEDEAIRQVLAELEIAPALARAVLRTEILQSIAGGVVQVSEIRAFFTTPGGRLAQALIREMAWRARADALARRVAELEAEVADLRPAAERALAAETGTIDWRTER